MKKLVRCISVIAVSYLGISIQSAHAMPGEGPLVGYAVAGYGQTGSLKVAGKAAYCIDINGSDPGPVSQWQKENIRGQQKQQGMNPVLMGVASVTGNIISDRELSEIAWILNAVEPHSNDPDWTTAADHAIRLRTAGDATQHDYVEKRRVAVTSAHPRVAEVLSQLDKGADTQAGPYSVELSWIQLPTEDTAGSAAIKVTSKSGHLVDVPIVITVDGVEQSISGSLIEVKAGAGMRTVSATATVPAAIPEMIVSQKYRVPGTVDSRAQRNVVKAEADKVSKNIIAEVSTSSKPLVTPSPSAVATPATPSSAVPESSSPSPAKELEVPTTTNELTSLRDGSSQPLIRAGNSVSKKWVGIVSAGLTFASAAWVLVRR